VGLWELRVVGPRTVGLFKFFGHYHRICNNIYNVRYDAVFSSSIICEGHFDFVVLVEIVVVLFNRDKLHLSYFGSISNIYHNCKLPRSGMSGAKSYCCFYVAPLSWMMGVWLFRPFADSPLACSPPGSFTRWLVCPLCLADSPPGFFTPSSWTFHPRSMPVIWHRGLYAVIVFRPRQFMHDDENKRLSVA